MTTEAVAAERAFDRAAIIRAAVTATLDRWKDVTPTAVAGSWRALLPEVMTIVAGAQLAAAVGADEYVDDALAEQDVTVARYGRVAASRLAGVASDGRTLDGLLMSPAAATITTLNTGAGMARAMATGQANLEMIVRTQVADAGRAADGVAVTARDRVGWIRMLVPPSCARCVILAGRWYRWDAGFPRHPVCNCTQIPAVEDTASDLRTSPRAYFDSLSTVDQDRVFTKNGARAIRDGADINQVVNARRGMSTASRDEFGNRIGRLAPTTTFGQEVFTTLEGTTVRGLAGKRLRADGGRQIPRLMPESIYKLAKDRADAVRLLRRFGYII